MKNLKEIYSKYTANMDQISKEFIQELKKGSKTYREVSNKLNSFEKELLWNNGKHVDKEFISHIIVLLEKEMNDSPIFEAEDLKETAQEVPVQEQRKLKAHIYIEDEVIFNQKINSIINLRNSLNNEMKDLISCFKVKI